MRKLLFTLLAGFIGFSSFGQTEDAKSLIEAYISPLGNSLGAALNNGWYNTAKPHSLGGFDVTITANIVMVPTTAKTFNISESNGGTFSGGETPTILGSGEGAQVNYTGLAEPQQAPGGIGIPIIPLPMLQAGVGVSFGTELDFRYMPELKIGDDAGKVGLFGIGIKHDILQWLPIADKAPIDLSIQAGYTKIKAEVGLDNTTDETSVPHQSNLGISATTVNLILSKKLLMFTPYLGVGYNSTRTTFNVDGDYDIAGFEIKLDELTDIDFESNNNLRANIGFRFNIAIIALQAN